MMGALKEYFQILSPYTALFLLVLLPEITVITATPPNEISWVKYDTVWDNITILTPVGRDGGRDQYLARLKHENNVYPARYIPGHYKHRLYWPLRGVEGTLDGEQLFKDRKVEFLKFPKGALHWVHVTGSRVNKEDMVGVGKMNGETAYPCRAYLKAAPYNVVSGYYQDSKGECFYAIHNRESHTKEHEVLALSPYGRVIGAKIPPVS